MKIVFGLVLGSILPVLAGSVYTTGQNMQGEVGHGDIGHPYEELLAVPGLPDNVVSVSFSKGNNTSFFLTADGEVYGCGHNMEFQLGGHTQSNVLEVKKLPLKTKFSAIFSGMFHINFLDEEGRVYVMGLVEGLVDFYETRTTGTPMRIPNLKNVIDVAAGDGINFYLTSSGEIWMNGNNKKINIRPPEGMDWHIPRKIITSRPGGKIIDIMYVHGYFTGVLYYLKENGSIYQVANTTGDGALSTTPLQIGESVKTLEPGGVWGYFLTHDGNVFGARIDRNDGIQLPKRLAVSNVKQLSAGSEDRVVVLHKDGTVSFRGFVPELMEKKSMSGVEAQTWKKAYLQFSPDHVEVGMNHVGFWKEKGL